MADRAEHNEALREKVELVELMDEQKEIENTFFALRFGQKIRHLGMSCFKDCGGKLQFPFRIDQMALLGGDEICFANCMNVKLEQGPFLRDLGHVPEDAIPKKFLWAHGIETPA